MDSSRFGRQQHRVLRHRGRRYLVAILGLVTSLLVVSPAPAVALTEVTWDTPSTFVENPDTDYSWNFTTATSATVSRVTMGVPAGTTPTAGTGRFLSLPGTVGNYARTPDSAAVSVTGDFDIRVRASLVDWTPSVLQVLVGKWWSGTGQRSYMFRNNTNGTLRLSVSPDGSQTNSYDFDSSGHFIPNGTAKWVRVQFDVDDGAGNQVVTFSMSDDGDSWTQIGSPVVRAGTSPLYDSGAGAPLEIGVRDVGTIQPMRGEIYRAELRNASNTLVSLFDPNAASWASPGSWAASTGETWTVYRSASGNKADIAALLTRVSVSGMPATGAGSLRAIDGVADYRFSISGAAVGADVPVAITLGDITNTTVPGTYTSTVTIYDNAADPVAVDSATSNSLAFSTTPERSAVVGVDVDPFLLFEVDNSATACNGQDSTAGQFVDNSAGSATALSLGNVNATRFGGASQILHVSTNARGGFLVYLRGTAVANDMIGPSGQIADSAGDHDASTSTMTLGAEAFGYTVDDPEVTTAYDFGSGEFAAVTNGNEEVMTAPAADMDDQHCVGYQVAASAATPAGTYSATLVYTAVPSF